MDDLVRSKQLGLYAEAEERMGVGTAAGQERLRGLRGYTWRRSPLAGAVGGRVFRTVSIRSPGSSWWYPPRVWVRHRHWPTKHGMHERVTVHTTPARDLKPRFLRGRPWRVVPFSRVAGADRHFPKRRGSRP